MWTKLDLNPLARSIVDQATGNALRKKLAPTLQQIAGQKGGLKGGKAPMAALTEAEPHRVGHEAPSGTQEGPGGKAGAALVKE